MARHKVAVGSHGGVAVDGTGRPGSAEDPKFLEPMNSCSVGIAQSEVEEGS